MSYGPFSPDPPLLEWTPADEELDPGARFIIWRAYTERREREAAEKTAKSSTAV